MISDEPKEAAVSLFNQSVHWPASDHTAHGTSLSLLLFHLILCLAESLCEGFFFFFCAKWSDTTASHFGLAEIHGSILVWRNLVLWVIWHKICYDKCDTSRRFSTGLFQGVKFTIKKMRFYCLESFFLISEVCDKTIKMDGWVWKC